MTTTDINYQSNTEIIQLPYKQFPWKWDKSWGLTQDDKDEMKTHLEETLVAKGPETGTLLHDPRYYENPREWRDQLRHELNLAKYFLDLDQLDLELSGTKERLKLFAGNGIDTAV